MKVCRHEDDGLDIAKLALSAVTSSPSTVSSEKIQIDVEIVRSLYFLGRALYRYSLLKKKEREK